MPLSDGGGIAEGERLLLVAARLEALVDAVPYAIALFDDGLRLVQANERARELMGLPAPCPDEPASSARCNAPTLDALFAAARDDVTPLVAAALAGHPAPPTCITLPGTEGRRIIEASFIWAGHGAGLLFTGTDVTERESLRLALDRRARELAAIFEVMPSSVRVFDASGSIVRFNTTAMRDHPSERPRTLGALWQLDEPRYASDGTRLEVHEHPVWRALRGATVRTELLLVRRGPNGEERMIDVHASPLRDTAGAICGAVNVERDVTERVTLARELEEQVRRSAALYERVSTEAERLERMVEARSRELLSLQESRARERRLAAVGQLAAGVMHDVNNALNPIMAAAYLLQRQAENPLAVRDYAHRINKAAETGAATAARVGRFIRQEPVTEGREESVDLTTLAEEVVAMTRPLWAERAHGGVVEYDDRCVPGTTTVGLPGEIREALLNLVQNALDAMPDGGTLSVETGCLDADVWVQVSDTGIGMTEDVRDRAFEPFFTTKGSGGSGLGLSEVYGIMKRHRGRAEIHSTLGFGTTVRLVFPIAAAVASPPAPSVVGVRAARRVLVVEDNDEGREFLAALLVSDGHSVDAVSSVHEARERLMLEMVRETSPRPVQSRAQSSEQEIEQSQHTPEDEASTQAPHPAPYDVLLTDVGLPDGSGWELVELVRERWPDMRVGVVTGWEPNTSMASAADFTLRKPLRAEQLLALVAAER